MSIIAPTIQRMGKMKPMKNMTLWPCFQVSTPAESKQISQRSQAILPTRTTRWPRACCSSFVGVAEKTRSWSGLLRCFSEDDVADYFHADDDEGEEEKRDRPSAGEEWNK